MTVPSSLEQARAQIVADLEATQGPWRRRALLVRLGVLLIPAVVVVAAAFVMLEPGRGVSPPVVVAGLASLLALIAVALAPERPAASERLAQAATVVAVGAFIAEVTRMQDGPVLTGVGRCLGTTVVVGIVAAIVIAVGLSASRAPLRLWHKLGLGVASTLGACAAVWHHCPSNEMVHLLLAHALGPVALLAVVVVVVGRLRA
ncbi:MAG: hypothetical protein Q8O67_08790 [Deltaproteobacteria bacterium]|nr:hypothetical protein [Deltaproteobacteria bacterium]